MIEFDNQIVEITTITFPKYSNRSLVISHPFYLTFLELIRINTSNILVILYSELSKQFLVNLVISIQLVRRKTNESIEAVRKKTLDVKNILFLLEEGSEI